MMSATLAYTILAAIVASAFAFIIGALRQSKASDELSQKVLDQIAHGDWPATSQMKATEHGDRQ